MAESNRFAAVEGQIAQVNARIKDVIEILQLLPDFRPIFTGQLSDLCRGVIKITEDLNSYGQRWKVAIATIDERESRLEREKKVLGKREKSRISGKSAWRITWVGSEDHNTMSQQPKNGSPPPSTPVARGKGRVASNLTLAVALQNLGSSSVSSQ